MKLFSILYTRMMIWSAHPHARYYLAGLSFAESSFFPIPPDVMLISMGLARPKHSWYYAWITTLFSVLGGLLGYGIGYYFMHLIEPYLLASSYRESYLHIRHWFDDSSLLMVFLAGFSPFPYKIFTISAGAMHLSFWYPFVVGSFLGRGFRFFLLAFVLYTAGPRLESRIRQCVDIIGWVLLLTLVIVYCCIQWIS